MKHTLLLSLFALFALLAFANGEETTGEEYEGLEGPEYENSPSAAPSLLQSSDSPSRSPTGTRSPTATRSPTVTHAPSVTTSFPTYRPTYALGMSGCKDITTVDECQARLLDCEWYVMNPCNYLVKPVTCAQFEYGCQERRSFCEFTKGTRLQKEMQCNFKNYPCTWKSGPAKCVNELIA